MPRREHEMIPWIIKRYAAHQLLYLAISSCASCNDSHFSLLNVDLNVGLYFKSTIITKSRLIALVA